MGFFSKFRIGRIALAFTTGGLSEVARSGIAISKGDIKEGLATADIGATSPLTVAATQQFGPDKVLIAKGAALGAGLAGAVEASTLAGSTIGAGAAGVGFGALQPQQALIAGLGATGIPGLAGGASLLLAPTPNEPPRYIAPGIPAPSPYPFVSYAGNAEPDRPPADLGTEPAPAPPALALLVLGGGAVLLLLLIRR